jgi:ubiquinone/menaquinone biosynthesis C-methylase UbiE
MNQLYKRGEERFGRFSTWFYSRLAQPFIKDLHRIALEEVLEYARKDEAKTVLDVGCGPGSVTCSIATQLSKAEVVGIDPSPFMVQAARHRAVRLGIRNVRFELGSSRTPPNGSYDLIYTVLSFHHWADQEKSLNTLYDHLAGKRLLVFEYNRNSSPFLFRSHSIASEYFKEFLGRTRFYNIQTFEKKRVVEGSFLK